MSYEHYSRLIAMQGDPSDCENCDGYGCIWNNADTTSGQWVQCDECEDTRGLP